MLLLQCFYYALSMSVTSMITSLCLSEELLAVQGGRCRRRLGSGQSQASKGLEGAGLTALTCNCAVCTWSVYGGTWLGPCIRLQLLYGPLVRFHIGPEWCIQEDGQKTEPETVEGSSRSLIGLLHGLSPDLRSVGSHLSARKNSHTSHLNGPNINFRMTIPAT